MFTSSFLVRRPERRSPRVTSPSSRSILVRIYTHNQEKGVCAIFLDQTLWLSRLLFFRRTRPAQQLHRSGNPLPLSVAFFKGGDESVDGAGLEVHFAPREPFSFVNFHGLGMTFPADSLPFPRPLCFVRRGFSSTGGAEAYLQRLAGCLASEGWDSALLTTADWPSEAWPYGPRVVLPGKTPLAFAQAVRDWQRKEKSRPLLFSLERVPGCAIFRAGDGVHAAWLQRRRCFEAPWRTWFRMMNRKHAQLLRLEKAVFDPLQTQAIIANSQMVAEEIARFFAFPAHRVHVVPNGVDATDSLPAAVERQKARVALGVSPEAFVALFVGSGWERKGLRFAVEACGRLPGCELLVAGRGNQAAYRGAHVHHCGPVKDLRPLHAAADILVHPTWYDPFSNACLEAWAAGLPVLTTRDNGMSELLVERQTGSIISRADACEEWVAALQFWQQVLGQDAGKWHRDCGDAARAWTTQRNVQSTLNILRLIFTV